MSFEPDRRSNAGKQVRKVAEKRLTKALTALQSRSRTVRSRDESVHTARKRLKEVRALLRLVRDDLGEKAFDRENRALRDAARPLSEVRDAGALVDAIRSLQKQYAGEVRTATFRPARKALRSRRSDIRRRILGKDRALRKAASAVKKVQSRVSGWELEPGAWKAVQAGVRRAYKQAGQAMALAFRESSDENLHEWRKRTKDLRYQLELLRPLWPDMMDTAAGQANKLTELLGDDHDLAVLRGLLDGDFQKAVPREAAETLRVLIDRRRNGLQAEARSLGEKLFAESTEQFAGRIKTYWRAAA